MEKKFDELAELQRNYIKWAKEIIRANPFLRGHWIRTMSIIESKHRHEIMRMLELFEDFSNDGDKDSIFMALVNRAEFEK